jgi:hypothetical protein
LKNAPRDSRINLIDCPSPKPCLVKKGWAIPQSLTPLQATALGEKKSLTFEDAVGLALFTATHEGPPGAMAAFTAVASELLYFASVKKLIYFNELDQAMTTYFITKATLGKAFPTTEITHIRRNLLMLIHLAANLYGINLPRYAAEVCEIKARIGGPRRPMMDDEIALGRLASLYKPFQGKGQSRTGRDTRSSRAGLCGMLESGSGSSELAQITADHLIPNGLTLTVELQGTRDAIKRTVELTKWAQDKCNELLSLDIFHDGRRHSLFYNGMIDASSAVAQASTSGVASSILDYAGLKQIGVKPLQVRLWRARSVFDATKKLSDAAQILGCSPLKAVKVLGIDPATLTGA